MTLKAIETRYRGYRFRSRLEARWAVFFDACGFGWEYEPQGYMVSGRPYLPDFYLPGLRAFAEVKPHEDAVEWPLLMQLAIESNRHVIALIGMPDDRWYPVACPPFTYEGIGGKYETIPPGRDWIDLPASADDQRLWIAGGQTKPDFPTCSGTLHGRDVVQAARSARFEHGEYP